MNISTNLGSPGATLLGRYRLQERISSSDVAEIYEATDLQLDRPVAVKIARSSLVRDPDIAERFRAEAQNVSALEHPGIPKLYDYGEAKGRPFLVTELVWGQSLESLLRNKEPLLVASALDIADDLLAALQHAHEHGVAHGAIDPANVLVTQGGRAKLVGFGAARAPSETRKNGKAAHGHSPSTWSYMAPEQLAGSPATVAGDLYATGVLLYQVLTGSLPFGGQTNRAGATRQMDGGFVSPSTVRFDVPPQMDRVLARALAPDPARRYSSAEEMRNGIARLGPAMVEDGDAEEAEVAPLPSLRARVLAPLSQRRALPRGAYALLAGLLIIGSVVALGATARNGEDVPEPVLGAGVSPATAAATTTGSTLTGLPVLAAPAEPTAGSTETVAGGQPTEPPATVGTLSSDGSTPGATGGPTPNNAPATTAGGITALSAGDPQPVAPTQAPAPADTSVPEPAPPATAASAPAPLSASAPPVQAPRPASVPPAVPTPRPSSAAPVVSTAFPSRPPTPVSTPRPTGAPVLPEPTAVPSPPEPTEVPPTAVPTQVPQATAEPTVAPTEIPTEVPPSPTVAPPPPTAVPPSPAPTETQPPPTATQEPDPVIQPTVVPGNDDADNNEDNEVKPTPVPGTDKPAKPPKKPKKP